jgi:prepilin-type N-terminal cleavage/methylation domain-containing protein
MAGLTVRNWTKARQQGFTLLEVLVSMIIVSLVVVVYFQIMSAGMKLEHSSRERIDRLLRARHIFDQLLLQDVRADDFKWRGEDGGCLWTLDIETVESRRSRSIEQTPLTIESELYRFVFRYRQADRELVRFVQYVSYDPGFFSDQFKDEHLE